MGIFREKKAEANSHVFISYSSQDKKIARQIHGELIELGLNPWISELNTAPGTNYAQVIQEVIENSLAVVLLITNDSLKSDQVQREVNLSVSNKKHLIPVNMSGRTDILKSAPSGWEYWLGIVQMFEHRDSKSTAEKILHNIEYATGFTFKSVFEQPVNSEMPNEEVSSTPIEVTDKDAVPPSTNKFLEPVSQNIAETELQQEAEPRFRITDLVKAIFKDRRKLALAGLASLVLTVGTALAFKSSEEASMNEELVRTSLTTDGRWVDQTFLETGKGHYFKIENADLAATGGFVGYFDFVGKKFQMKRLYVSLEVTNKGRITGKLSNDMELTGSISYNSPDNYGQAILTFKDCQGQFPWVDKEEGCTFYQYGD